ncbi:unnamed protein product [Colias eurytheme]|nr:unnamed protein product [Colias eurytheme]
MPKFIVSVETCKEDWTKLRNSFASALKRRRNKKSGQAAMPLTPWKYEDQMNFLSPFMESRNTKTNLASSLEPIQSPSELTSDRSTASPYNRSESQCSVRSSSSSRQNSVKPGMQELYELMKSSNDLRIQKQNERRERDMDENDLFFLSMSKAVKSLSILEQTKIKLDLHSAVSNAQIRHLEKQQTDKVLQTPINLHPTKSFRHNKLFPHPNRRQLINNTNNLFSHTINLLPFTIQSHQHLQPCYPHRHLTHHHNK